MNLNDGALQCSTPETGRHVFVYSIEEKFFLQLEVSYTTSSHFNMFEPQVLNWSCMISLQKMSGGYKQIVINKFPQAVAYCLVLPIHRCVQGSLRQITQEGFEPGTFHSRSIPSPVKKIHRHTTRWDLNPQPFIIVSYHSDCLVA